MMKDNIRSNIVKESLLDYENLAKALKENTSEAVKNLLNESVRETYNKILTEEEDDDDDVNVEDTVTDEDEDTDSDNNEETEDTDDNDYEIEEVEDTESDDDDSNSTEDNIESEPVQADGMDNTDDTTSSENDEWAEFDKYKISDDEYDFSNAEDDEIVKVYKLLKDDDQVLVNVDKENQRVDLKDNETGAEYLLDLNTEDEPLNNENNMHESRIFELVLNEYDSHLGYTDDYQKKTAMTTPDNHEVGKNVNDWDAGVPKGTEKPWGKVGKSEPFNEEDEMDDITMEEGTNVGGFVQQNSVSKSHIPNSNGRKARNSSVAGVKTKSTSVPRYSETNESKKIMKRVNKIFEENEELKKTLVKFKKILQEAAVTNVNLGQIVKLISENSTTKAEKEDIINRFSNEAKTVEQSKALYESISRELKKNKVKISEDKQFTVDNTKKINETPIYQSKDLLESLDLMHRLCK